MKNSKIISEKQEELMKLEQLTKLEWNEENYQIFLNYLLEQKEEKYRQFQASLLLKETKLIGIRTPYLHKIAKAIAKGNYELFLEKNQYQYHEEILIAGLILGYISEKKISIEKRIQLISDFIPKINNWANCDMTVSNLKICKKYPKEFYTFLHSYLKSDKEYELRFVIVMLMNYYRKEPYMEEIFKILNQIDTSYYYVNMAIAWCYSYYYITDKQKTLSELKEKKRILEKQKEQGMINKNLFFVYQKSLHKIVESLRIEKEEKEQIRKMYL